MPIGLDAEDVVVTGKRPALVPWMEPYVDADRDRARAVLRHERGRWSAVAVTPAPGSRQT